MTLRYFDTALPVKLLLQIHDLITMKIDKSPETLIKPHGPDVFEYFGIRRPVTPVKPVQFKRIEKKKNVQKVMVPQEKNRMNIELFPPDLCKELNDMVPIITTVEAITQEKKAREDFKDSTGAVPSK